jgi:hypothetical protein
MSPMGFKQIAISAVFLAACSSTGGSGGSSPPGSRTNEDASGSQTGGEGSILGCRVVSTTEVDVAEARELGFPVDEHLALFNQTFEAPFHRGNVICSAGPLSVDGHVRVHAELHRIDYVQQASLLNAPDSCPTSQLEELRYHTTIELSTDNGTVLGSFESLAYVERPDPTTTPVAGLNFSVSNDVAAFAGALGIRVDPTRTHRGVLGGNIAIGATPWASQLFTLVDYTDGAEPLQDQGDGIFWPADLQDLAGQGLCNYLGYDVPQRDPISIDDYNAL